jgi:hypothetical protein
VPPQPRIGLILGSRVESCEVEILFQDAEPSQLLPVLHRLEPLREPALLASIGGGFPRAEVAGMTEDGLDARTRASMNLALERICRHSPDGEDHQFRQLVAQRIVQCAKSGKKTLGALTEARERVLARLPELVGSRPVRVRRSLRTISIGGGARKDEP